MNNLPAVQKVGPVAIPDPVREMVGQAVALNDTTPIVEMAVKIEGLLEVAARLKDPTLLREVCKQLLELRAAMIDGYTKLLRPAGQRQAKLGLTDETEFYDKRDAAAKVGFSFQTILRWKKEIEASDSFDQLIEDLTQRILNFVNKNAPDKGDEEDTDEKEDTRTDEEIIADLEARVPNERVIRIAKRILVKNGLAAEFEIEPVEPIAPFVPFSQREVTQPEVEFTTPLRNMRKKDEPMPVKVIVEPDTFETADLGKAGPEFAALNAANYARRAAEKKARDEEFYARRAKAGFHPVEGEDSF